MPTCRPALSRPALDLYFSVSDEKGRLSRVGLSISAFIARGFDVRCTTRRDTKHVFYQGQKVATLYKSWDEALSHAS